MGFERNQVLSRRDLEDCKYVLASFNSDVALYCADIKNAIKKFEESPITESLFSSGSFGEFHKNQLDKLIAVIEDYLDTITGPGGLRSETQKYIDNQLDYVTKIIRGYSVSDSHSARRGGK